MNTTYPIPTLKSWPITINEIKVNFVAVPDQFSQVSEVQIVDALADVCQWSIQAQQTSSVIICWKSEDGIETRAAGEASRVVGLLPHGYIETEFFRRPHAGLSAPFATGPSVEFWSQFKKP